MMPQPQGSFRLFRLFGIDVFLHWSWLIIALVEFNLRAGKYASPVWNVAEYLTLFGIVLLHEFGHSLACRQVGGIARYVVLWPLGGVAYVSPPPRPGALLWSIAAGPLVNVALLPVMYALSVLSDVGNWDLTMPDLYLYVYSIGLINLGLLIFNILPIYPLDGGQILQALLWFVIGRIWSLKVACTIGLLGGFSLLALALYLKSVWFGVLAVFMAMRSFAGFQQARALSLLAQAPRHEELRCPSCGAHPLRGPFWRCDQCQNAFDTFDSGAQCPKCGATFPETACPDCHRRHPIMDWLPPVVHDGGSRA